MVNLNRLSDEDWINKVISTTDTDEIYLLMWQHLIAYTDGINETNIMDYSILLSATNIRLINHLERLNIKINNKTSSKSMQGKYLMFSEYHNEIYVANSPFE